MGRGLTAVAAASLLLVAGCGGESPREGGVAGVQVERGAAEGGGWATEDEVEWLERVAAWNKEFSDAGREVAEFEAGGAFEEVLRGDDDAIEAYADALEPIRRCGETFAEDVGGAPSERLRDPERRFRDSCTHYRRGVDLMLRAVEEQDDGLAGRSRTEIEDAGKEAAIAAGQLPPGEKQPLPRGRAGSESRIDPTFSEAASLVAGKPVEARCWSPDDWERLMVEESAYTRGKVNDTVLGFASAGGERLNLAPQICHDLARLAHRGQRPRAEEQRFRLALSAATLAHESVHASGVADEPTAECHGIQWLGRTAGALGVERDYGEQLVAAYWAHYDDLPEMYRSAECRDGGDLDLDEASASFP